MTSGHLLVSDTDVQNAFRILNAGKWLYHANRTATATTRHAQSCLLSFLPSTAHTALSSVYFLLLFIPVSYKFQHPLSLSCFSFVPFLY